MFWSHENIVKENKIRADIEKYERLLEKKRYQLSRLYHKVYNENKKNGL